MNSQNKTTLAHLQSCGTVTSLEALNLFGCMRLASRVNDLKKKWVMKSNLQPKTKMANGIQDIL